MYKFKAMDEEVKETWCRMLQDVLDGKYRTIEDMQRRGMGEEKKGEEVRRSCAVQIDEHLSVG